MGLFDNKLVKKICTFQFILPVGACLLWLFSFRGFLTRKLLLIADAFPYYEHTKFFVDNLSRGVIPLWDPTWRCGVPNEFFLRRMGEFNPVYLLMLFADKWGVNADSSYFSFLAGYFFLGMWGFYCLALICFKDKRVAFTASLILMFSTFSCNLFNSFINLIFVPSVWFFFFFASFASKQQRSTFFGMIYCLMLILTVYIPFYFVTLFFSFCLFFLICYPQKTFHIIKNYWRFIRCNKIFVVVCCVLCACALYPGVAYFQSAYQGEFVLPNRSAQVQTSSALEVSLQHVSVGGVITINFLDDLFSNLKEIVLGRFYLPIFVHVLLCLGFIVAINKRLILFLSWGFFMYLLGVYGATPIYKILFKYVFFFKYFRNFQFFVWLIFLPLYVFICAEQFRCFLNVINEQNKKVLRSIQIILVHIGVFVFLLFQQGVVWTSYVVLVGSLIYFCALVCGCFKKHQIVGYVVLFVVIVLQPLQVYFYLNQNARSLQTAYRYETDYHSFSYGRSPQLNASVLAYNIYRHKKDLSAFEKNPLFEKPWIPIYYGTSGYSSLRQNLPLGIFASYIQDKFVLYDEVEAYPQGKIDFSVIEKAFVQNLNLAFVSSADKDVVGGNDHLNFPSQAVRIKGESEAFKVKAYDVNSVEIVTDYSVKKFLVYNDSYHSKWRATLNDVPVKVVRANVAFKGLWVPAGKNRIVFRYGSNWDYVLKAFFMSLFLGGFIVLVGLLKKSEPLI